MRKRVEDLERCFREMKNEIRWLKRLGYYMAAIMTTLTFKILFFGV